MAKTFQENNVVINLENTILTPKKNEIMYNPDMTHNRALTYCALVTYLKSGICVNKPPRCLDALGATGVSGLSWAKNLPEVDVTINATSEASCRKIVENTQLNNVQVEITHSDVNVLLIQRSFDFIFIDCYGSSVHYLNAAFRNLPKNGLLVINSTDDAALFGKAPNVTLRNYGAHIIKTFYSKELAARLIIASLVREAARCNKGVEILASLAIKSHITVIARVLRGPAHAIRCINKIQRVLHCCLCEDRVFYPKSIHPIENPYSLLSCNCRKKSSGHVAVELGPVWSGPIFNANFCTEIMRNSIKHSQPQKFTNILQTVAIESHGGIELEKLQKLEIGDKLFSFPDESESTSSSKGPETAFKKQKTEISPGCSPFYYNLHRHSPKGYDLGKLNKIVAFLRNSGFKASRTHFDPEAIRTNASLKEFIQLLINFATSSAI